MKRWTATALLLLVAIGFASLAAAETEIKMAGDARIYATYWSHFNYTGWNAKGTTTSDSFTIWERFRLRMDFIANEHLKFRAMLRLRQTPWGNGGLTVDNPDASILDLPVAYLQFKVPHTGIMAYVGYQSLSLPMSGELFAKNPVIGAANASAAIIDVPVTETLAITAGFTRLVDTNKDFDTTTTQKADELDAYFMALPITLDGYKITPWGVMAVLGRDASYSTVLTGAPPKNSNANLGNNMLPVLAYSSPSTALRNAQNLYWWGGGAFSFTALDPFKFYGDIMYGAGNQNDRNQNKRSGWFFDIGAEYTGFDNVTPQMAFWYSSGEDDSARNGSERMPRISGEWMPCNSFFFDTKDYAAFGGGFLALNPVGSWGFAASLDKIHFIQDLTHRITFTYARGTNSAKALRYANKVTGVGYYAQMGRDLTENESIMGINMDHKYNIYENLAFVVESGWAHGNFQTSVWGRRFTNQAKNGDAFKVAFGLTYKF